SPGGRGLRRRRGEQLIVEVEEVVDLAGGPGPQPATTLLSTIADLKAADVADVLHDLPMDRQLELAAELSDERLADVLEELSEDDRVAIVSAMEANRAADVLDLMQPDDAADLVNELPPDVAGSLLELMEPEEAEDVRRLIAYPERTAGGLMTTEPIILPPESTVAVALASARRPDVTPALATMVFVVRPPLETPSGKLLGVVHIQRALREPPAVQLGSLLDVDIETVGPHDDIGKVTRLLATYNLTALPVVDDEGRLLGAISVDDVLDHLLPEDWRDADTDDTDTAMTRSVHGGSPRHPAAHPTTLPAPAPGGLGDGRQRRRGARPLHRYAALPRLPHRVLHRVARLEHAGTREPAFRLRRPGLHRAHPHAVPPGLLRGTAHPAGAEPPGRPRPGRRRAGPPARRAQPRRHRVPRPRAGRAASCAGRRRHAGLRALRAARAARGAAPGGGRAALSGPWPGRRALGRPGPR